MKAQKPVYKVGEQANQNTKVKRYVITGGPGSGKTDILNAIAGLHDPRFFCVYSAARKIIEEELENKTPYEQKLLPATKRDDFQKKVMNLELDWTKGAPKEAKAMFIETGYLDKRAYYINENKTLPQEVFNEKPSFRYNKVFLLDILQDYSHNGIITQTREEALKINEIIKALYQYENYNIIPVPNFDSDSSKNLEKRVQFILKKTNYKPIEYKQKN